MTARLTPSERTVLILLANGRTPPQLARELRLRPATITRHLNRAGRKLGRTGAGAITARAREVGEIQSSEILTPSTDLLLVMLAQAEERAERYRLAWASARRRNRVYRRALDQRRVEQIWAIAHSFKEAA